MAEHTEELIGLMRRTIEQKEEQIRELKEMIGSLQDTAAGLNETIEELRRKFFGTSSEKTRRRAAQEEAEEEPEKMPVRSPAQGSQSPGGKTSTPPCRSGKSAVPCRRI